MEGGRGTATGGYELLQVLLTNGLRYGDKKIFHRYHSIDQSVVLFSVASVHKPGTFDLSQMGDYICPGLTLFMLCDSNETTQMSVSTFDLMLETTKQLCEDLGGEILDEERLPLTQEHIDNIRMRLLQLQKQHSVSAIEG